MADSQKIHPVQDPPESQEEQRPTAPLVPRGSFRSDNGNPEQQQQQQQQQQYPPHSLPPIRRTIPYSYEKPPPKRNCCRRCICWTISLIFLLIIILGIIAAIIYFVFQPKVPKYSVDSMRITQFNLGNDMSLSATFNVNITARNPNKKIGIYYEGGSHLSVWFSGTKLCEGSLPKFYQGHRNTTVLNLTLNGQTDNGSNLLQNLEAQRQTGNIPLNLRAKVPVRLKLGKLKLMKWKFLVRCRLNVDSLDTNNAIRIRNSSCKFRFRL